MTVQPSSMVAVGVVLLLGLVAGRLLAVAAGAVVSEVVGRGAGRLVVGAGSTGAIVDEGNGVGRLGSSADGS
ncbi:hypothetical protein [Micromonospora zingiberis]|uniref:hypothetical protein n=1 Tax=Micromonospora zingiberis TaxID=2053011 RepID=UPI001F0CE757|nr:hypothetical protein [Micromonospora zingiberis]